MTLTASSGGLSRFTGWSGPCSAAPFSGTCTVSMDQARAVTATFVPLTTVLVRIENVDNQPFTGASFGNNVVQAPGQPQCQNAVPGPVQCSWTVVVGQELVMTAVPWPSLSRFGGWSGPCIPSGPTCRFTPTAGVVPTFTATFLDD